MPVSKVTPFSLLKVLMMSPGAQVFSCFLINDWHWCARIHTLIILKGAALLFVSTRSKSKQNNDRKEWPARAHGSGVVRAIRGSPTPGTGAKSTCNSALSINIGNFVAVAGEQSLGRAHFSTQG